eukprot:scaffold2476_cov193-Amphora_coffeaeformis.AAC.4
MAAARVRRGGVNFEANIAKRAGRRPNTDHYPKFGSSSNIPTCIPIALFGRYHTTPFCHIFYHTPVTMLSLKPNQEPDMIRNLRRDTRRKS